MTKGVIDAEAILNRARPLAHQQAPEIQRMDVNCYRRRLLQLEARLSSHIRREVESGREQLIDTAADAGDESVARRVRKRAAASRCGNWFIDQVHNGSVYLG